VASLLCFVLLTGVVGPDELRAQTPAGKGATATQGSPVETVPLGRYVPKDNLILYIEFAGLDAHSASWHNTAAYKMLTNTPLGGMLEEVSSQLLDKALNLFPNRRLNGAESVALVKNAAHSGWLLAIHATPEGPAPFRGTIVLRGAVSKDLKPISSRLMGWLMGNDAKYRIERKEGRTLVVLPLLGGAQGPAGADFAWWPEKNDLVICSSFGVATDSTIAALDGKIPCAADHPVVQDLKKPEGTFEPVCVAFAETANCPEGAAALNRYLRNLHGEHGINRIDLRWGFDAEALMSVVRLAAPLPRKTTLALFDKPTFDKTALLPMPDSVESFVELSIAPNKLIEAIEQIAPEGAFKEEIDALAEAIKTAGSIDLRKDLLAHLGPRMVAYLAPGRSAATNDDSLEAALKNGFSATAAVTVMQSLFPKLTLVAEVKDPEAFGKALDPAIIAINNELKAQAMEQAAHDRAATEAGAPGEAARTPTGRPAGTGDRTKRRRAISYPKFTSVPGQLKSFVLMTPTDSALRFGPSSFRPTILLEDKYVAFAVSADAARAAVAAVRRKDWKPSSDLAQACQKVPSNLVMLSVTDVNESLSSLLASLPGTLQTMLNTSFGLANARAGGPGATPARGASQPGAPTAAMSGSGMAARMMAMQGGGGAGGGGSPGFGPDARETARSAGASGGGGNGSAGSTSDSMIVLKVDSDKLPKAADLKSNLFASSLSVSVADEEVKFVSRGAFPNLSLPISLVPVAGAMPALQSLLERAQQAAQSAGPNAGEAAAAAGAPGAAGSPAAGQPGDPRGRPAGGAMQGRRGRRGPG